MQDDIADTAARLCVQACHHEPERRQLQLAGATLTSALARICADAARELLLRGEASTVIARSSLTLERCARLIATAVEPLHRVIASERCSDMTAADGTAHMACLQVRSYACTRVHRCCIARGRTPGACPVAPWHIPVI